MFEVKVTVMYNDGSKNTRQYIVENMAQALSRAEDDLLNHLRSVKTITMEIVNSRKLN